MHTDIKKIMAKHCDHWKLDRKLAKHLAQFKKSFITLNEDHINFFGGNLMGVYRVRFGIEHRLDLTENILGVDDIQIQKEVRALDHIGSNWIRGTDGLNLTLTYLVHVLAVDTKLSANAKREMQMDALLILQYKFMSSWMNYSFKYLVNQQVALATYQALSGKFLIKKFKTWQQVLEYRSEDILIHSDAHRQTIRTFEDDNAVQYLVTTIQTQIKSMIINIYGVTIDIIEKGGKVRSQSSHIEMDGEQLLRDVTRKQNDYLTYIKGISTNPREFIKLDLVEIIDATITTLPKKLFLDVLLLHCEECSNISSPSIELTEEIIYHCFGYFSENPDAASDLKDLSNVLKTVKDLYTAGRSIDPSVLKSRAIGEKIAKKATNTSSSVTIAALRTGLILYILVRALTKEHYG